MSITEEAGLDLVARLASDLRTIRDPDAAMTAALELLYTRLGASVGVAWELRPAGQWRLVATRGHSASVLGLVVGHPRPEIAGDAAAAPDDVTATSDGLQVWVRTAAGDPVAAVRVAGLPPDWDPDALARLAAAVGGVLGRACEYLVREQRYEQAQRVAGVGSWQWRADLDRVWLSEQMYRNLGTRPETFEHTLAGYLDRVHPDDRDTVLNQVDAARREGRTWYTLHRLVADDGEVRWIEGHGSVECDEQGTAVSIAGVGQDVTRRRELEEELTVRSERDELTGLGNRRAFQQRLTETLEAGARDRDGRMTVVALVDVDDFHRVNEQWGWAAGDRLLQEVADRLRRVEGVELAARLAGDEFALLFRAPARPETVERLGEDLVARVHQPSPPQVEGTVVEVAVGLASTLHDGELSDELLRAASVALQVAKSRASARWQVFDPAKHEHALQRLALEADLRHAVDQGRIEVAYQPVLSLETGDITGVEALARWHRPGDGDVPPATFIPLAERTGLMPRLGAQVLETACRQLQAWDRARPDTAPGYVGVNLSALQLDDPALLDVVDDVLARCDLAPERLVLEITETTISHDLPGALARLFELRRRGIRIAIDDFGTGYSSLARLREIPFDILKIDRSFIKDIASRHEPTPILHALFSISRSLDLDVVAEGVETPVQLAVMLHHDCHAVQGFLFSRPLDAEGLGALLDDDPGWDPVAIAGQVPAPKTSPRLQELLDELASTDAEPAAGLVDEILSVLVELTGLDSIYLTRIDFHRDTQQILAARNHGAVTIPEGVEISWSQTLCRRALAAGSPIIEDVSREHPDADVARELGIGTYVGVEVHGPKGGLRGTLCGVSATVTEIGQETVETLQWVARLLADPVRRLDATPALELR